MRTSRLVSARPRIGTCNAGDLPTLTATLDAEFISGRGRTGSLAVRYPDVLTDANLPHLYVRHQAGAIVSACATRRFTWTSGHERWQGAMIGFVHTAPSARGHGHAAALLEAAIDALAADGVDFAVLWSALEGYYERLGWEAHDRGIFGSVGGDGEAQIQTSGEETMAIDVARYETLRAPLAKPRVTRHAASYRCIPVPAARVRTVFAQGGEDEAGALVGEAPGARYVYEVVGGIAAFPALWQAITCGAARVHVNECIGSPFHRWLVRHAPIKFAGQALAYWRMLSPRAGRTAWREWHIPYFDRI